jgi:2-polyprenyl-6-methoxyphenol hydroxylase-like FAD-dependent oxidoreductase
LVCGGRIEALSAALTLKTSNKFTVDVCVDDTKDFNEREGNPLLLTPNATNILKKLGILEEVLKEGRMIELMTICADKGMKLCSVDFEKISQENNQNPFIGISEQILLQVNLRF